MKTRPCTKSPSKGKEESGNFSEAKGGKDFKQNVIRPKGGNALAGGLVKENRTLWRGWLPTGLLCVSAFGAFVHCFELRRKLFVPECFVSDSNN